jgi:ABC-type transport system involved in multi-copper enzyme maturation permease subunit
MSNQSLLIQLKNDLWNERMKFLILLLLFLFQAISSIISIFYMEEILALFNIEFINPVPPTGEAALLDFFNDQFLFAILIMSLGTMSIYAAEIENNSISYSLTRPISRTKYTMARIVARITALVLPFIIATFVGWIYMAFVFEIFSLDRLLLSLSVLVLLFIYLGTITSALSTRFSALTAGLGAIALFMVQFSISAFKPIELLSPFTSATLWSDFLLNVSVPLNEMLIKLAILGGWILVPFLLAIYSMKTRDF